MWIYFKGAALVIPYSFYVALASGVCGVVAAELAILMGANVMLPPMWQIIVALVFGFMVSAGSYFTSMFFMSVLFNQVIMAKTRFALGVTQCLSMGVLVWLTIAPSNPATLGGGLGEEWIFLCLVGWTIPLFLMFSAFFGISIFQGLKMKIIASWQGAKLVESWSEWMHARLETCTTAAMSGAGLLVKSIREARKVVINKGVGDAEKWAQIEHDTLSKVVGQSSSPSKPTRRL